MVGEDMARHEPRAQAPSTRARAYVRAGTRHVRMGAQRATQGATDHPHFPGHSTQHQARCASLPIRENVMQLPRRGRNSAKQCPRGHMPKCCASPIPKHPAGEHVARGGGGQQAASKGRACAHKHSFRWRRCRRKTNCLPMQSSRAPCMHAWRGARRIILFANKTKTMHQVQPACQRCIGRYAAAAAAAAAHNAQEAKSARRLIARWLGLAWQFGKKAARARVAQTWQVGR